jgi:DNA-binding phage protein
MKTISDVANTLRVAAEEMLTNPSRLSNATGLTYITVRDCLSGAKDSRLTTVLAIASQLGMELVLVPREVAAKLEAHPGQDAVQTLVGKATQK